MTCWTRCRRGVVEARGVWGKGRVEQGACGARCVWDKGCVGQGACLVCGEGGLRVETLRAEQAARAAAAGGSRNPRAAVLCAASASDAAAVGYAAAPKGIRRAHL